MSGGDFHYSFVTPDCNVPVEAAFTENASIPNFFADVSADDYYDAVLWASGNGVAGSMDEAHFAPDAACTRAQTVTFLYRSHGN